MNKHRSQTSSQTSSGVRAWSTWLGAVALCTTFAASGLADAQAQSIDMCGEIGLANGVVSTGDALAPAVPLSDATSACLKAVAAKLGERPLLRSVTVIVRLPDDQRQKGEALLVAQAMSKVLTDNGLAARKVSVVAPAVGHGQQAGVTLVYRESRAGRAIARIDNMRGDVRGGSDASALLPLAPGATLRAYDYLETGVDGNALVTLADKSVIKIGPSTKIELGNISLTKDYRRQVRIEILAGAVETSVDSSDGKADFELITRAAVAGVRGTRFRAAVQNDGRTRVETISGQVGLGNSSGQVTVSGGFGSRAAEGMAPEEPRALLMPPTRLAPLQGTFAAAPTVEWNPADGAAGYVVEVARNAQFTRDVSWIDSPGTSLTLDASMATGRWFWRVSPVDGDGFVGIRSKIFSFVIDPTVTPVMPAP